MIAKYRNEHWKMYLKFIGKYKFENLDVFSSQGGDQSSGAGDSFQTLRSNG